LVSASNDYTTRFWSRERPGDATSVFSGGGEKPPEAGEGEGGPEDEDEMADVPGFAFGNINSGAEPYWQRRQDTMDEDDSVPGFSGGGDAPGLGGQRQGGPPPNSDEMYAGGTDWAGRDRKWGGGGRGGRGRY
jgi:polyadenylation factor subunit 2